MKLYSWLRALLIFMVMSAVLTNIIPPRYEGSYKVVMRLIFLMILLKPVLLLLFNEEYITDRVNTLYNDYSKNIAGYSSSYTGDSSLQSDYYSYVSNAVKQTVISRVLNIAEECKVEVNNVKVELNDKSILNKSDTLSAFISPSLVSFITHERRHSGLLSLIISPIFSNLSSVLDIVVTSIRQTSDSSLCVICPPFFNSYNILGCPCPTVNPISIK